MTDPNFLDQQPHALYRFYGAGGTLLYIGLTANLPTRLINHRDEKPWWTGVARITVEHFPDRASVVEAERRAIEAERPLYNVQHNRPQASPPRTAKVAATDRIVARCFGCKLDVSGSPRAAIHLHLTSVGEYQRQYKEWEQRCIDESPFPGSGVIGGHLLLEIPSRPGWAIHCDSCNPHDNGDGTLCGGCYWWSLDRCRTHGELLRWTAHLISKKWFKHTAWDQLIYRLAPNVVEP
jgi:hypothetical protein